MRISSNFDSGNIEVIELNASSDIRLAIRKDSQSDHFQWFYYNLQGAKGILCQMKITNAGASSYIEGWQDYKACASYDRQHWFRVPTEFDGQNLIIQHMPTEDSVFYAYFPPYSYERHLDLLHRAQLHPQCQMDNLGQTIDGRNFNCLIFGEPSDKKKNIYIIARQHPGESMAEWFMEGLIDRLLDPSDAVSKTLLMDAVLYLVPNMNPDGSVRGHLRTNAVGRNLNREWQEPDLKMSPEVFFVRELMENTGVDLFLDVHGDEALPYNFLAFNEGIPGYSDRLANLENTFVEAWLKINPEIQNEKGYAKSEPGKANLAIASNWVGNTFDCLSVTVEMPFKDNSNLPDDKLGWTIDRSKLLGRSVLETIRFVLNDLR